MDAVSNGLRRGLFYWVRIMVQLEGAGCGVESSKSDSLHSF